MQPIEILDRDRTPDGTEIQLSRRGGTFYITVGGIELMASTQHGSADELATLACRDLRPAKAVRLLVGGLGMGFTVRAALDVLPAGGRIVVAEALPAIVRWNQGLLGPLASHPLHDRRVALHAGDVWDALHEASFDAILLDVDNGPAALTLSMNSRLYEPRGVARLRHALRDGGVLAIWSSAPDARFLARLRQGGLSARIETARAHARGKGARHTIFLALKMPPMDASRHGMTPPARSSVAADVASVRGPRRPPRARRP